jgi:hypothetical protein
MPKKFWWPGAMPAQLVLIQNFQSKIGQYATILGLSPAQMTAANGLCDAFVGSFNSAEQCKTSMLAVTRWRDEVMYGSPAGQPSPAAPVFPVIGANDYTLGVVTQFFQLRDLIVASPGYNSQIGDDLGIVGTEIAPTPPDLVTPNLKPVTSAGFWVNLTGSMQGMDALRVEYARSGGQFSTVAFLTKTPGGFQITPQNPNQPESGHIRAVFIKKNAEYGNYSADYPVTVS